MKKAFLLSFIVAFIAIYTLNAQIKSINWVGTADNYRMKYEPVGNYNPRSLFSAQLGGDIQIGLSKHFDLRTGLRLAQIHYAAFPYIWCTVGEDEERLRIMWEQGIETHDFELGVPLAIRYNFLSKNTFRPYAEATTHILMDLHNGDGLRYEWGAALGMETALSKRLWLFLQPSVRRSLWYGKSWYVPQQRTVLSLELGVKRLLTQQKR